MYVYRSVFGVFIATYAMYIAANASFGVIDDSGMTKTVLIGKNILLSDHIGPYVGRFFPLLGVDINILSNVFGASPGVFFAFNAVVLVLSALTLLFILKHFLLKCNTGTEDIRNVLCFMGVSVFLVSPSFGASISRLFVPEKLETLFMLVSVACCLILTKRTSYTVFSIGILAGVISLFYKEPASIVFGVFTLLNIAYLYKDKKARNRKILALYNSVLAMSCLTWACIYYSMIYSKRGDHLYGYSPLNSMYVFCKNLANYTFNEPFLMIMMSTLVVYRAYLVVIKRERVLFALDSMMVAGLVHVLIFMKLLIMDNHYLLPTYAFAAAPILYYSYIYIHKMFVRAALGMSIFLLVCNSIPYNIYLLSFYKASGNNMTNTTKFLAQYTKQNEDTHIYMHGVGSYPSMESIGAIGNWIRYYQGEDKTRFSMMYPVDYKVPFSEEMLRGKRPQKKGDVLILTPFTTEHITQEKIRSIEEEYDMVFKSSFLGGYGEIKRFDLKTLIKYMLRGKTTSLYFSDNFRGYPLSYIVYVKK